MKVPKGGDIVDWLDSHGETAEPDELRRQIELLVEQSVPVSPQCAGDKTVAHSEEPGALCEKTLVRPRNTASSSGEDVITSRRRWPTHVMQSVWNIDETVHQGSKQR